MPAHTDWGSVTMLFQDDCGGLEVQNRHGEFVKAPPLKNAIIMNIGDILMRWSNGMFLDCIRIHSTQEEDDRG